MTGQPVEAHTESRDGAAGPERAGSVYEEVEGPGGASPLMRRRIENTLCVATLGFVLTGALSAAPLLGQVYLTGTTISHETLEPIPYVAVSVLDSDGQVFATSIGDQDGTFSFNVPEEGRISLKAERIGYETVVTPSVRVDRFRSMGVELRMSPEAVPLAPLEVVVHVPRPTSPFHSDFEHRRRRGFGRYISQEEIEERNPAFVTDVLRSIPGVYIRSSGQGRNAIVYTGRLADIQGQCPAQIYVDGFHVNRAGGTTFRIDDIVTPSDVYGIEVYRGLSTVPPEFLSPQADCGVVAIWTRRRGG